MVELNDIFEASDEQEDLQEAEDLIALKACLRALADAVASTNLAVLNGAQGDPGGATARVQASVAALKRFNEAFLVLDEQPTPRSGDVASEED